MKIYAIIGGLVVIAGIAWFILHTGEKLCEGEHAAVAISDAGTHDTIENKVIKLADPDLDKRLSKWMRD